MKITKRDGTILDFDQTKINVAISKANEASRPDDKITTDQIDEVTKKVVDKCYQVDHRLGVEEIQDLVIDTLAESGYYGLMRVYSDYRYKRALIRKKNTTDDSMLSLLQGTNKELNEENSNKSTVLVSTQRDYMAGEVSRDITRRLMLPEKITKAHDEGAIHFHDLDYFIQPMINCCLLDAKSILDEGTVMNGKMIESPKSFQVACTVLTQVIANIASNQFGLTCLPN